MNGAECPVCHLRTLPLIPADSWVTGVCCQNCGSVFAVHDGVMDQTPEPNATDASPELTPTIETEAGAERKIA